jgi:hypothetical protein
MNMREPGIFHARFFGFERIKHDIGRHEFGERRRLDGFVSIEFGQYLLRRHVHQQISSGSDFGCLWCLGMCVEDTQASKQNDPATEENGAHVKSHDNLCSKKTNVVQRTERPITAGQACRWRTTKPFNRGNCP